MSWLCRDREILEEDLDTLTFEPGESRVVILERKHGVPDIFKKLSITTEKEWQAWLDQDHSNERDSSSRINLILGGRAERPWADPSLVSKLPWSRETFSQIRTRLLIHGSIVQAINRNTSCMFSHMGFNWDLDQSSTRSIVYNCRSAASWPQDMALSVTFLTDSLTTNAVLFGCDAKTPSMSDNEMTLPDLIISRLSNSDAPAYHPMLLPTIFADIERDRQIVLVREKLQQLSQRVVNLVKISSEPPNPVPIVVHDQSANLTPTDRAQPRMTGRSLRKLREVASWMTKASSTSQSNSMQEEKATQQSVPSSMEAKKGERPTAMLWLEISRLRNGLGNWQRQLHKMIDHVDMLNATEFSWEKPSSNGGFQSNPKLRQLFEAGSRIKERLQVLVDEYDEHMRDCTHIMDGLNLATQLELSHIGRTDAKTNLDISRVNLDVARMTRRDSSLMKSIAMLGMIFLPATLVTAFFSMDFFDWRGEEAGYLWVYAVAVAALTLLTVGIFYVYVLRRQRSRNDGGEDKPFMSA